MPKPIDDVYYSMDISKLISDFVWAEGLKVKPVGDELQALYCPYCHGGEKKDKNTFSINTKTGQFNCKRASCGAEGNLFTLAKDFPEFSLGREIDEYLTPKKRYAEIRQPKGAIVSKDPAVRYLKSRGISEEVAKRYEITIAKDKNGKDQDNILFFPFYDEKGVLVYIKYRNTDFQKGRDKSKEWSEADCRPVLFGIKQCVDFDRLVITEGQLDSLSVATAGIDNAVSVPGGKNNWSWIPYCRDWMNRFSEIVVFGDFENGSMTLLDDIRSRFPSKTIKYVREADYQGCKDANELLQKHGKEAVRKAVENAENVPIVHIKKLSEVENVDIYSFEKLKTGIQQLDNELYGGIPFGCVCLIGGKRGEGKSTLASQILANALDQNYSIMAYSGEMRNEVFKNWFDRQIAGPDHIITKTNEFTGAVDHYITPSNREIISQWYSESAYIYNSSDVGADEKVDLINIIKQTIIQTDVRVILVDNLMTAMYLDESTMLNKYDQQGWFVRRLAELATTYNCLILLVAHRRKNSTYGNYDANDEISGNSDITNLAGVTLSYDQFSEKEIEDKGYSKDQRKLIIAKNRLYGGTNTEGIVLSFDERSKRIYGDKDDPNKSFGCWKDADGWQLVYDDETLPFD